MQRLLFPTLLIALFSTALSAQITLTADNATEVGLVTKTNFANAPGLIIDPSVNGPNITFDFSQIPVGQIAISEAMVVAAIPNGQFYPDANLG